MTIADKRLFLLDMDGTLYLDDTLFPKVREFLARIREKGGRYLFLTNNSSRGVESYVGKMNRLGIPAAADDFFTSVDATVLYLKKRFGERATEMKIYLAGTGSFLSQMRAEGFAVTTEREEGTELLLSGFDRELTFQKLEDMCILLGQDIPWVATNPDWVCPTRYGYVPDCGSVSEMLTRATGRHPDFVGKPEPLMAYAAMEKAGFAPEETLLVGDRLYTDIACGVNAGIDTVLVLSGETTAEQADSSDIKPTYRLRDIEELYGLYQ